MVLVIQHIDIEGPGLIQKFFEKKGPPVTVLKINQGASFPETAQGITAVIILSGPMNVYEEDIYPFLKEEDRFIREVLDAHVPILGICLGSQLLAKACGASVERGEAREMGWHTIKLTDEGKTDPLFANCPDEPVVFQWHEDQFRIPVGGTLLAASSVCPHQAFRVNGNAYGIQFHIEVTPEMVASWILEYLSPESLTQSDVYHMVKDYFGRETAFQAQTERILSNFSALIPKKRL